jgi:hypothetical protein
MSLNRRLYTWLLGPESHPSYFPKYGLCSLSNSLRKLLVAQDGLAADPIRVSKLSLALLDTWEIGGHVVSEVFTPMMETVFTKPESSVLGSARALFDGMDPAVIWAELASWIEDGKVAMLIWVVERFNLREEEMLVRHIPQVLLHILCLLRHHILQGSQWFVLARKLIQLLPSRAFTSSKGIDLGSDLSDVELNVFVRDYYSNIRANVGTDAPLPESISGAYFHRHVLKILSSIGERGLETNLPDWTLEWTTLLRNASDIIAPLQEVDMSPIVRNLHLALRHQDDFQLLGTIIETTIALAQHNYISKAVFQLPADNTEPDEELSSSLPSTLINRLWRNLGPDRAAHHVESVTYIWSLTSLLPASLIETLLALEIERTSLSDDDKAQACARFTVLWKHAVDRSGTAAILTKAMMLILRFLKGEEGSSGRAGVERWLAGLGNSAHRYVSCKSLTVECLILSFRNFLRISC